MRRTAFLLVALACCAALGLPAGAPASPVPTGAVSMGFTLPSSQRGIYLSSAADCLSLQGGWNRFGDQHYVGTSFKPGGLLDVPGRAGEVIVPREGIHVERIFIPHPKAVGAFDVGLELAGRRAYLTGTLHGTRAFSIRVAPRRRLVSLSRVSITSKANHGHLLVTVHARARMLRPLAATFERLRCKGPRESGHAIRTGESLGPFTAAIDPARAIATAGTTTLGIAVYGSGYSGPSVEPTGGARSTDKGMRFAWAPGTHVPAACTDVCVPSSGTLHLAGGFDVVQGAQRVSFTDLALDVAGERYTISATVAGARRTGATGDRSRLDFTPDAIALIGSVLGDPEISGAMSPPSFAPTQLAPA
jgi:hypothetical protein